MSFSLAGSTITQTGTDTDLSGLSGIAGVSVLEAGFKTIYRLDAGTILRVSGVLTLSSDIEELISTSADAVLVLSGGVLNVGVVTTINGDLRQSTGTALVLPSTGTALSVNSGGTLNIEGGDLFIAGRIELRSGSTSVFNGGRIIGTRNVSLRIRASGTLILNGTEVSDNIRYDFLDGNVIINSFSTNYQTFGGFQALSAVTGSTGLFIRGFATTGSTYAGDAFLGALVGFINPITTGGEFLVLTHNNAGGDKNISPVIQEVAVSVQDTSNAMISGARLYIKDTNNGLRYNQVPVYTGGASSLIDQRSDIIYNQITNNTGVIDTFDIYTRFLRGGQSNGGIYGNSRSTWPASSLTEVDYRGLNGDDSDLFRFSYASYNHALSIDQVVVQGLGGVLDITKTLLPDLSITEQNQSVVDAYTSINNSAQFYDRAKSYLVTNYLGETETITTRSGSTIDTRDLNVVIDPLASAPFDLTGTTITIRTALFVGNIETTGTVTLLNGATVSGSITDSSGTLSNIRFTGVRDNTEVRLFTVDGNEFGVGTESSSGGIVTIPYTYTGTDIPVRAIVISLGFLNQTIEGITLTDTVSSVPVSQTVDRQYLNPL